MATYDWTGTDIIPNGSGSAVRADLNDALLALFSQNSSATAPPETVAYMPWADTANGLYKIRNAANSDWITLYQLDGEWTTIALENGTAAAPSLYFKDSGTDTGIYSPGTDQVAIATAGVQRVNFNGSTEVVFNDGGADVDFRIEGDTEPNLFKVDAGTDTVIIDGLTHPSADGTADQALVTNGSGVLSFASRSRLISGTAVASTSGTSIDFTSIPSWVKRVTVMFNGVSTSGASFLQVQLGSGSFATSGYISGANFAGSNAAGSSYSSTTGLLVEAGSGSSASHIYGQMTLALFGSNTWSESFTTATELLGVYYLIAGGGVSPALSGPLDRVRITTVNGTDTFDAGSINILYEG
jgi:hypothetical protein